ncbi:hypothetical protein B566_EDAN011391 [Ephemera danica]|nr:hypothetical protein B566_EDAN011391 [Ephemera danica]
MKLKVHTDPVLTGSVRTAVQFQIPVSVPLKEQHSTEVRVWSGTARTKQKNKFRTVPRYFVPLVLRKEHIHNN